MMKFLILYRERGVDGWKSVKVAARDAVQAENYFFERRARKYNVPEKAPEVVDVMTMSMRNMSM